MERERTAEPTLSHSSARRASGPRNRLYFWQSNYVVKIDGPHEASGPLAQVALGEAFLGRSRKPPVSNICRPRHLVQGTEKYMLSAEGIDRGSAWIRISFGFEVQRGGRHGRYIASMVRRARLLLLLYPDTAPREEVRASRSESRRDSAGCFGNGSDRCSRSFTESKDQSIATVHSGRRESRIQSDLERDASRTSAYGKMILTIFTFIGVALLFTLVAGISFRRFRVFVKARLSRSGF